MKNLDEYILNAFPQGLPYNEAAQLCLRLYRTVEGVPENLHNQCSKDGLAEVFANLTSRGFLTTEALTAALYGSNFHNVNEKGHWVEVIASIFKKGDTVDSELGEVVANRLTLRSSGTPQKRGAP